MIWVKSAIWILWTMVSIGTSASSDFRLELARKLVKEGKVNMAIREYKNFLSENPHAPDVYEELAELRMRQGKYKFAILNFSLALKQNPDLETAQEGLALGYELNSEREKALIEWRKLASTTTSTSVKNRAESHIVSLLKKLKEPNVPEAKDLEKETKDQAKKKAAVAEKAPDQKPSVIDENTDKKNVKAVIPPEKKEEREVQKAKEAGDSALWSTEKKLQVQKQEKKESSTQPGKKDPKLTEKKKESSDVPDPMDEIISLYNSGNKDKSLLAVRSLLRKSPGHPGAYYYGGIIRYDKGDYSKAIYNFKQSFEHPEFGFNAHFYLGRIYQKLNQRQKAIDAFERYIKKTKSESGKKQAEAYIKQLKNTETSKNAAAEVSEQNSEVRDPAVARFENGLMFFIPDKNKTDSKHSEAVKLLETKKWEQAINLLKELSGNYGGSFKSDIAELNIGSIYERMGLYDKAKNKLQVYLSSSHKDVFKNQAEYLLAKSEIGLKNWTEAEKSLNRLRVDNKWGPGEIEREKLWASFYLGNGQKDKAVMHLEKLASKLPEPGDKIDVWLQLANIHESLKHPIAREKTLVKAKSECDKKPGESCAAVFLELADGYFKSKKWKSSQSAYNQFLKSFPSHKEAAWAEYQLGNVYKKTGKYKKALDKYKEMMEKYPDSYWAAQAKWEREDAIWKNEYSDVLD